MSKISSTLAAFMAIMLATSAQGQCPGPGCPSGSRLGAALAGGIIGGMIAGVVPQQGLERRNRQLQAALNHFGFDAGEEDGQVGERTRAAIRRAQEVLGVNASGELSAFDRLLLISAFQRSSISGPSSASLNSQSLEERRSALLAVRDEAMEAAMVALQRPRQLAAPVAAAQPAMRPPNASGSSAQVSLAQHCNRVSLVTAASGGLSDISNMTDPIFTLNEQFCLARSYAIADGEAVMAELEVSPADITSDCEALEVVLQSQVAALSFQSREVVLASTIEWMQSSNMSTSDLTIYARVCLSSGYSSDNLDVALSSALVLSALGEASYGELLGHHLMQGIGAVQRRDLAEQWFSAALAVPQTEEPAFQPGPPARNELIISAMRTATGASVAPSVSHEK